MKVLLHCDLTLQYEKQSLKLVVTAVFCIDLQFSADLEHHKYAHLGACESF